MDRATRRESCYGEALVATPAEADTLKAMLTQVGFTRRTLTAHQLRDVARLVALPAGATFSVPGAGKTTVALAYYYLRREPATRLLVVCPKNAFAAWEEQTRLCVANPPSVARLTGGIQSIENLLQGNPETMLITYQQLVTASSLLASQMLEHPTFMFLDESHRIKKGLGGVWASTVLRLSHLPCAKLILSGTPLPNAISDLVPQFRFLYPGVPTDQNSAPSLVRPIFVRTTKAELGLPPVSRKMVAVPMRPKQRNLYELLRSEKARQLEGLTLTDRNRLRAFGRAVMRLLQLISNPALLVGAAPEFADRLYEVLEEGDGPKVEYACQRARQLANDKKKVTIWSGFVQNVELIATRLSDIGADFIHGGVDAGSEHEADTREYKIRRFHDDDGAYVLVANPAACAEGISLHTVCHHAVYVDRNFNAAQYLQSEDRIHRLGLPPDVITHVEIPYCPDTLDESVDRRLKIKVSRMARVLNDDSLNIEPVTTDLDEFGLTPGDVDDVLRHLTRAE
jgi:SNF2 family DNA or RNA helicase